MTSALNTVKVSCSGGLDKKSTTQELLSKPGAAVQLINFEQSIGGGYRRINGYKQISLYPVPTIQEEIPV